MKPPDLTAKLVEKAAALNSAVGESEKLHWTKRQEHHATRKPSVSPPDRAPASPSDVPRVDHQRRRDAEAMLERTGPIGVSLPKT